MYIHTGSRKMYIERDNGYMGFQHDCYSGQFAMYITRTALLLLPHAAVAAIATVAANSERGNFGKALMQQL
jgi:hypothetical protein